MMGTEMEIKKLVDMQKELDKALIYGRIEPLDYIIESRNVQYWMCEIKREKRMKYFKVQELVSEEIYNKYSESYILSRFFDNRMLQTLDSIREHFGALTVNNWSYGGNRTESGLRVQGMKNYNFTSLHSWGRAFDIVSKKYTAEEMRKEILKNQYKFPFIRRMEKDVPWLHIDNYTTNNKYIVLFGA